MQATIKAMLKISHDNDKYFTMEMEPDMTQLLDQTWLSRLSCLDYAFQPIVNIHTGVCYGYEALLRNYEAAGMECIHDFFDQAHHDNVLHPVDMELRNMAIAKFAQLPWKGHVKLFFNLDNRVLNSATYRPGNTLNVLMSSGLSIDSMCFEISERHELQDHEACTRVLNVYRDQGFKIAVDDCGAGFSGFKLLYYTRPEFIKIDRFFIQDIPTDINKRIFVSSIVNLAHVMGSIVIAEGVETKKEYYSCRNIGCDLIQGYLVQRPVVDMNQLQSTYAHIHEFSQEEQRKEKSGDKKLIDTEMEYITPVLNTSNVFDVFEKFKSQSSRFSFFPVINSNQESLGIISDKSFKHYTFSRFGSQLLMNPAIGKNLDRFITRYPVTDIHTPVEKILEIYTQNENIEGIIIADNLKYKGFLSARSLLKVLNEKNIAIARDQNPLTRLPGNALIYKYVSDALQQLEIQYHFIYFDFDNFKPYNDTYGFRQGDRVILLFSEILKNRTQDSLRFGGHIGGDDFFMGIQGMELDNVFSKIRKMCRRFQRDVESFYDSESIQKGCISAKDRDGQPTFFPLLTVSAVILEIPAGRSTVYSAEEIGKKMAKMKKTAKHDHEKICVVRIDDKGDLVTIANTTFPGEPVL
jgi:diguanylate cyclase (GGDEF)-like protein